MARVSYLARREGRYYLQVRCSHVVAGLLNQPLFRTSLRTAVSSGAAACRRTTLMGEGHLADDLQSFQKQIGQLAIKLKRQIATAIAQEASRRAHDRR